MYIPEYLIKQTRKHFNKIECSDDYIKLSRTCYDNVTIDKTYIYKNGAVSAGVLLTSEEFIVIATIHKSLFSIK